MGKVTLRSIWEHKRRLASTVLAIVLGVAFMSGTLVFADTIDQAFDDLFSDVNEGVDVQVQGAKLFDAGFGGGADARVELDASLVDEVAQVEGVDRVAPFVQTLGVGPTNRIVGPDGDVLGSASGPPTLLESWVDDDVLSQYRIVEGRAPRADDEVALNIGAVEDTGTDLGDTVTLLSHLGETDYEVVGTFGLGQAESAAGAVSAEFTLTEAQRIAGLDGRVQTILVRGDGSVDDATLAARIAAALPPGAEAVTGAEAAADDADAAQEGFAFFRRVLTIFGAVALLVGTFIISNTFSILVAQRTRELALLRAIGASRRQVLASVLLEATAIGVVAAIGGLVGGVGLAVLVTAGLATAGVDLPTAGLVVSTSTIGIAFAIGLGVTVLAALLPAAHATRVPPLAALREVSVDRSGASRTRAAAGAVLLVAATAGLTTAWRAERDVDSVPAVGAGALALVIGAIVIGPVLAEPTVRVLGRWLPRVKGITGRLATENAARSPKRTSATASALLIGVALIGFITIFGSTARASVRDEVERGFSGDLIVQAEAGVGPPAGFPPAVADDVAAVEGVDEVSPVSLTEAQITRPGGEQTIQFLTAIDPGTVTAVFEPRMAVGDITDLTADGIVVDVAIAEDDGLSVGDPVLVTGPGGATKELVVEAVSDDVTLLGFWVIDTESYGDLVSERQLVQVVVSVDEGADVATVQRRIEAVVDDRPGLDVLDEDGFIGDLASQITGFLNLINGLLLLSVIIAVIGIANTLSLSIHERTRELGLLRAVGMTRSQLRSAVRWEAVLIAVLGTVVGLAVGLVASWALLTALESLGLSTFAVPFGSLAVVVLAAATLAIVASIGPARRAARLDVLAAIGTE